MSDRPFKVLGIQQIAVSGLDKNRLRDAVGRYAWSGAERHVQERV